MGFGRRSRGRERETERRVSRLERDLADLRRKAKTIEQGKERRRLRLVTSRPRIVGRALFTGKAAQKRRRKRLPKVIHRYGPAERQKLRKMT